MTTRVKVFLYTFIFVFGLGSLNFPTPARSVIVIIGFNCVQVPDGYSNAGVVDCQPRYGDDGSGSRSSGDRLDSGGGGRAIPNRGDVPTPQRDAAVKDCGSQAGNPVVFSTGNKIQPELDVASRGEMGLSLTRTYNYYWNGIGIFGRRWLSNYDYKLLFTTDDPTSSCYPRPGNDRCDPLNKTIWAQRPDGRKIKFNYSNSPTPGWYEDKPYPVARILQAGSAYTLYSEDRTVEIYDYNGFPTTIKSRPGIGWRFTYDGNHYLTRVTHSSGRHIDFGWSNGLLSQITDPAGNVYRYTYTTIAINNSTMASTQSIAAVGGPGGSSANLQMIAPEPQDPPPTPVNPPIKGMVALLVGTIQPGTAGSSQASSLTYHYEDARFRSALTGKSINGIRYSWFAYDPHGMAIESKHANGAEGYRFAYVLDANNAIVQSTVTNPLGKQTVYSFNADGRQVSVTGLASTHCLASAKASEYDNNGNPAGRTDFKGSVTLYTYASNGQLQTKIEAYDTPVARTTHYVWDTSNNRVIKEALERDHEASYTYGVDDRIASVTVKNVSPKVGASTNQAPQVPQLSA